MTNNKTLEQLRDFAHERQRIYLRRKAGKPWPWTKDTILSKFFFENVYREQDKTTVWLRENWREPFADHKNLWFAMCLARQINHPPTLEEIGFPAKWDPNRAYAILKARKARGEKIYGSAYILGTNNPDKHRYTIFDSCNNLYETANPKYLQGTSLEQAFQYITKFFGFGDSNWGFIAYECITDLRHTRYLRNASDTMTWTNPGPGACRGLNRLHGRPVDIRPGREGMIQELRTVLKWMQRNSDPKILPALELRDIEHTVCCWDKHCRAKEGGKTLGLRLYSPPRRKILNLFGEEVCA